MADRSIRRWIRIQFDRLSAKKAEGEMGAALGAAGKKGGENFLRELRAAFDKRMADLKNQLAKGLIDPKQFKAQADLAAKQFNSGLLAGMEKARAAGKLTDSEYLKLSRTFKRTGEEGAGAWDRIKAAIVRAGAALALAFGIRAGIRFAFSSIREFLDSEKDWKSLEGTINSAGGSFAALEKRVRDAATAFQNLTVHSDEDYARSLQRLIALTGDIEGSIQNMTVAADFAARFFGGDLAAATEAVSRGMLTGTVLINRMRFSFDELRQRALGGTAEATQTLAGKLQQLNNQWRELKEQIGSVLVGGRETVGVLDTLTTSVKAMVKWVGDNRQELQRWAAEGINTAISGLRTLLNLTRTFLQLRGKLSLTAGADAFQPGKTAKQIEAQQKVLEQQRKEEQTKFNRIKAEIAALEAEDVPQKLKELNQSKLDRLRSDLQESRDLLQQIADNSVIAKGALDDLSAPPPGGKRLSKLTADELAEIERLRKESADTLADLTKKVQDTELALVGDHQREYEELTRAFWDRIKKLQGSALAEGIDLLAKAQSNLLLKQSGIFDDALPNRLDQNIGDVKVGGAPTEFPTFGEDAASRAKIDAANFSSPWIDALALIHNEVEGQGTLFRELGEAWAEGGIAGLARLAAGKVRENIARGIEELAKAAGSLFYNPAEAASHALAAAKHGAAVIAWKLAGAVGGGGGAASSSGGVGSGAPNQPRSAAVEKQTPETHIHFKGSSFFIPEVQKQIYASQIEARQKYGQNAKIIVHRDN